LFLVGHLGGHKGGASKAIAFEMNVNAKFL